MLDSLDTLIAFVLIMLVVSLLITIAVQMVSAALNLRGWNLLKGLSQSIRVIAPELDKEAAQLARTVLKGGMLSDSSFKHWPSRWRLATAARPDEVFDSIHRIATGRKKVDSDDIVASAKTLLGALGLDPSTLTRAGVPAVAASSNTAKVLATDIAALPEGEMKERLKDGLAALTKQLQTYAGNAATAATAGATQIDQAYEKFEYWYEIAQERVQQWFTTHSRIITIVFAFIFAFALQLDTVEIFKTVSSNRALRNQLVTQSGAIGSQAERVFAGSANVLQDAYAAWSKQAPADVQAAVKDLSIQPNDTRETFTQKLLRSLPGDGSAKNEQLAKFNQVLDDTATGILKQRAGDYSAVKTDFDQTGFSLFPDYSRGGRWTYGWRQGWSGHWPGMFFSVALLSLGAPFWYNILKNLTSLRSTVAQNIAEEKKQDQGQPPAAGAGTGAAAPLVKAPPTTR